MGKLFAYHVVTEKPMIVGQHIIFDETHHNSVWKRVTERQNIVKNIYNNPEEYKNKEIEHHISVALRELALEKIRQEKYLNYPSRMACLYVSKTLKEAENWFKYFTDIGRPTFQIIKVKIEGKVFYGDATKCFDATVYEQDNLIKAEKYWENKENPDGEEPIVEMLVDGDIEVIEIIKEQFN